jgi:cytochrome d ubiquinol oxidase subunit I
MELDGVMLARIQFAFTMTFHIIFPTFTIGLSAWIATLEGIWLKTGEDRYHQLARFWTKIFAVSFAMGVVSGIVMSYEFGTNWSRFSEIVGNVVSPLIGYEILTAFFLEATFLGIMLFGWNKVPRGLHFTASVVVAVGTLMSAFWILAANSWMQYPVGHVMRDGIAYPEDWLKVIFNPTFPLRIAHMVIAAYLTTAFVILGIGARYLIRSQHKPYAQIMMRMGLGMALVLAPAQLIIGDQHGLKTAKYQPAKIAAIEAHWDSSKPGALVLFALPDEDAEKNNFEIAIPNGASLLITHDLNGLFPGLKDFPKEDRPPVLIPFFGFRLMVGIGFWFILLAGWGALRWRRGKLFDKGLYLTLASWSWPLGFVALLAGWFVTEVGRQPWLATGILRTIDASSPITTAQVSVSLALFVVVYSIVFAAGIYYINRLINKGPTKAIINAKEDGGANRPISAAGAAGRQTLGSEV